MIALKSDRELEVMRKACQITAAARQLAGEMIRPGISTGRSTRPSMTSSCHRAPSPPSCTTAAYPASVCISVNDQVIHGIPDKHTKLKEGDIVSIDVGAYYQGFHGDCAATFPLRKDQPAGAEAHRRDPPELFRGHRYARQGARISDISHAVQTYAEQFGYGVVRSYVGHGVGEKLHEEPEVPNYGAPGRGPRLIRGMTLAIEPMINQGTHEVRGAPRRLDSGDEGRRPVGAL